MTANPLNTGDSKVLDGSGNGIISLGPAVGQTWQLSVASIFVAPVPPATASVKIPNCYIYIGGSAEPINQVDATFVGNQNSTSRVSGYLIKKGAKVFAKWTGGDPGAIATLSIFGTEIT